MEREPGRLVRHLPTGEEGTAFPVFRDHHVHLGLVGYDALSDGGIGAVVDLGWSPDIVDLADAARIPVAYAGCFLTAPGGYPSDRAWAPEGSTRTVADPSQAAAAVAEQVDLGASLVKVVLNNEAGPVLDTATLAAVVDASPVPVVAHVQGPGMLRVALDAGVAVLAHTPWTERASDDEIARSARSQRWISTLDIHGYGTSSPEQDTAVDNLSRFHAAGGEVLYGTDLGNGDLPVGLNERELALLVRAGLRPRALVHALVAPFAGPAVSDRLSFVPGSPGHDAAAWLSRARVVAADETAAG
ncbi:hypothetical protein [Nocardioides sp. Root140]|uniref:hypothetical protein n=1 Tax=Nocardioides sp. Root140 TaxID=1736460 RepID=UPI0007015696|nr:hypothetical protein [Nocardioides sp. Root140]KQY63714.1 hypothetical protein ASD30_01560 [Nocardioides sp. Root140]